MPNMDLIKIYDMVNGLLNAIDFSALYKGFHKYGFALYNKQEIIISGKTIPYQEGFRGNTSIFYEGESIAIWNMELDPIDDPEHLAYCLVHEMFHCHQRANGETRYPSDLALLDYPDDEENFTNKYNENRYLTEAYITRDIVQLRKFAYIRENRYRRYPSMVCQEMKTETIEGLAEYVGLKALERINREKYDRIVAEYLDKLKAETGLLFDVRRISYFSGAIFFLCLDRFGFTVNHDFGSEKTAYEQNPIDIAGEVAEVYHYDFVQTKLEALVKEREAKIKAHIQRSKYIEYSASIYGYDPMNMFRVGNLIYCSHFVSLEQSGEVRDLNSAVVLRLLEGSVGTVLGYYI